MWTDSAVNFRRITLGPAKDRRRGDSEAALFDHLLQMAVAQLIRQVPADAEPDDFSFMMAPLEGRSIVQHGSELMAL